MKLPELDSRKFYLIGTILFGIAIFGSLWSLYITWINQNIGGKIYSVSSLLFQALLMLFFYNLYKTSPIPIPVDQQEELNKLVQEYSQ